MLDVTRLWPVSASETRSRPWRHRAHSGCADQEDLEPRYPSLSRGHPPSLATVTWAQKPQSLVSDMRAQKQRPNLAPGDLCLSVAVCARLSRAETTDRGPPSGCGRDLACPLFLQVLSEGPLLYDALRSSCSCHWSWLEVDLP